MLFCLPPAGLSTRRRADGMRAIEVFSFLRPRGQYKRDSARTSLFGRIIPSLCWVLSDLLLAPAIVIHVIATPNDVFRSHRIVKDGKGRNGYSARSFDHVVSGLARRQHQLFLTPVI